MSRIRSSLFTYSVASKSFSTEISTLSANVPNGRVFHQVYPDACDQGLTLISDLTGKAVDYAVDRYIYGPEGELDAWKLVPTRESIRKVPSVKGTSMTIFND